MEGVAGAVVEGAAGTVVEGVAGTVGAGSHAAMNIKDANAMALQFFSIKMTS